MSIEWRRDEVTPSAERQGDDNSLRDAIRTEIESGGPITFARFMERALYDPAHGYYISAVDRPTRAGDFLTAPELHPIFGRTLALQVEEMWQRLGNPASFVLREYGAGSGARFESIVEGLVRVGSPLADAVAYEPVDFARQRASIQERLTKLGRAGQLVPLSEHAQRKTGVVIANEYVDALPVHRVIQMN